MRGTEVSEFIDLAYTWQERATRAEAEVDRLRKISRTLVDDIDAYHQDVVRLETENARLRKGRQYQESNAALRAKLDNAIDTAFDLEAKNARLRKVVRDLLEVVEMLHPNMNPDEPCVVYEAWVQGKQALAEYDKTNINAEGE